MTGAWAALKAKAGWHLNSMLLRHLEVLRAIGGTLTVKDMFGTPGDTILTAMICREIKGRVPGLRINCVTPNPAILKHDPNIDTLNASDTRCLLQSWYLGIIAAKDGRTNVLAETMRKVGIADYDYQAKVYLTSEEQEMAGSKASSLRRPIISINAMSREKVKVWPLEYWHSLVPRLASMGTVIQLGDDEEPLLDGVVRLAGSLSLRESMAMLSEADVHVGSVSFLMHAANGLNVPSVIIYGGRETPVNSGYDSNTNLYTPLECSPCWLHDSRGDRCPYGVACMQAISPETVMQAVEEKLALCAT